MFDRAITLALLSGLILGCDSQPPAADSLEENKVLVRKFFQAVDESRGSPDFIDDWMTDDFRTYFNSRNPMDLEGYRGFMSEALAAFTDMDHEIHFLVAESDLVAASITLHMVHSGEYLRVAPTGRRVSVEEMVVVRLRDGKIAEEWVVFDFAALQQQLTAPTDAAS